MLNINIIFVSIINNLVMVYGIFSFIIKKAKNVNG